MNDAIWANQVSKVDREGLTRTLKQGNQAMFICKING